MKRLVVVSIILCFSLSLVSLALAGDMRRGTIKGIDQENHTVLFSPEGTVDTFKMRIGPKVDLSSIKTGSRVRIYVEGEGESEEVKGIKLDKRQAIIGC